MARQAYVLALVMALAGLAGASKMEAPLSLALTSTSLPEVGQETTLVLEVTPQVDVPEMRLVFHLPEGLELVEGTTELTLGPARAGEVRRGEIRVRALRAGTFDILAGASYSQGKGGSRAAGTRLTLQVGPPIQAAPKGQGEVKVNSQGRMVIEHR